jgi:hypothetical protein
MQLVQSAEASLVEATMSLQTLENLANYIDDFMLSAPYLPDHNAAFSFFLDILRDFLAALIRFGVQLSYAKTRCGAEAQQQRSSSAVQQPSPGSRARSAVAERQRSDKDWQKS